MDGEQDYILELGGRRVNSEAPAERVDRDGRPYIGVRFECCGVYTRIYKNREGTAYVGWCPKCARKITVKVGAEGVNCRFFRAR